LLLLLRLLLLRLLLLLLLRARLLRLQLVMAAAGASLAAGAAHLPACVRAAGW
jgi:hypothetical protein